MRTLQTSQLIQLLQGRSYCTRPWNNRNTAQQDTTGQRTRDGDMRHRRNIVGNVQHQCSVWRQLQLAAYQACLRTGNGVHMQLPAHLVLVCTCSCLPIHKRKHGALDLLLRDRRTLRPHAHIVPGSCGGGEGQGRAGHCPPFPVPASEA